MNKYLRNAFSFPYGVIKVCFTKLFHIKEYNASPFCILSPSSEITIEYGSILRTGRFLKMRDGSKIRVRTNGVCILDNNVSLATGVIITCHDRIEIGSGTQIAPNTMIYDHDHDFGVEGGLAALKYKTAPIIIGKNVWIGANTVILKGTTVGNNSVIGAGSVIKGDYPSNSVILQKRTTEIRKYNTI